MNLKIKGGRSFFYQWDSGQTVIVEHEGTIHEAHFAHKGDENALTVSVKTIENGVEANVPNILLQSSEDIFAYLVFHDKDGTETRKAVRIPVLSRPKPETYVYTESEVLNYAYLDERLKELEGEGLANAVADYLEKNPPKAGATATEAAQIQQNKTDIEQLAQDKLDASKLPEVVNDALAQAKASGAFDGKDYVLTDADKQEIAEQAAKMVEVPEGDTVELDTTLTASGKAADAKAVGDALNGKLSKSGGTMTGKIVFPTADQNVGFANSEDMKIFGYGTFNGAMHMRMGDTRYPFQIRGNGERPKYNDSEIALVGDIPTDDHINSLINTALGVIENGTY